MRRSSLLFVALLLTGCTFAAVQPQMVVLPPTGVPKVLVLTDLQIKDELWGPHKIQFRRSVQEWIKRNGGFESVLTERPAMLGNDAIVLVGTLTEVDEGSTALRWIVGFGAGQAKVKGEFEIQSPTGATLARFSARESYLGGAGIGGAGFLGRTGTEAAPLHSGLEDVDGDGDTDMVLHFNTRAAGIQCGDTSASLTGETLRGQMIEGADPIKTVGCK
jgi:hypothetical protein